MKPIKITRENAAAIEAALKAVNGTATAHTYATADEIMALTIAADDALDAILYRKDHAGAQWRETSGAKVANSYRGTRIATKVRLERRPSGWFLIAVEPATIGNNGGGKGRLYLTPAQDTAAKAKLAEGYWIIQDEGV